MKKRKPFTIELCVFLILLIAFSVQMFNNEREYLLKNFDFTYAYLTHILTVFLPAVIAIFILIKRLPFIPLSKSSLSSSTTPYVPLGFRPRSSFGDQTTDLILQKDQSGSWNDITYRIYNISPINSLKYRVTFAGSSLKSFDYNKENIVWFQYPNNISSDKNIISFDGMPISANDIVYKFGRYIKVVSASGYGKLYLSNQMSIKKNALNSKKVRNTFEYFKKISSASSITLKDDNVTLLRKQYDRIRHLHPDSILSKYLRGKYNKYAPSISKAFISPFDCNISQMKAVKNAFSHSISIIEGPPGTGKTQTILNIIANVIMQGKTIAIVSNNNAAVENVYDKLNSNNLSFIAATLGKYENRADFFASEHPLPNLSSKRLGKIKVLYNWLKLRVLSVRLWILLRAQNKNATLQLELDRLLTEQIHFNNQINPSTLILDGSIENIFRNWSAKKLLKFLAKFDVFSETNAFDSFIPKTELLIKYKIKDSTAISDHLSEVSLFLHTQYYIRRIDEIKASQSTLQNQITRNDFKKLMSEHQNISMALLFNKLHEKYIAFSHIPQFSNQSFRSRFDEFLQYFPLVLSTTHSIMNSIDSGYLFDYLIIDESSQVDLVTGCLAFNCCKNIVVVGDSEQLPPIVDSQLAEKVAAADKCYNVAPFYSYCPNSVLSSFKGLYAKKVPTVILREHYRCHPRIIEFCNQKFYDDRLIIMSSEKGQRFPLLVVKTVPGNHARSENGSYYNLRQIDIIEQEILPSTILLSTNEHIGVVAPFRSHVNKAYDRLSAYGLDVDTVHKFQGREKNVMIYCTVTNQTTDFSDDPNLVNVAISRAKDQLIVIASPDVAKQHGTNIGDLIRYIEYNGVDGSTVIESKVVSIFDGLYSCYSDNRLALQHSLPNRSKYKSENLMYRLITDILNTADFNCFYCSLHVKLSMVINPIHIAADLTEREFQYLTHPNTHVDFIIFNKMDKEPVLGIEVDGVAYHANDPTQLERDAIKARLFELVGLPLLRFATNASGERERIVAALNAVKGITDVKKMA